MDQISKEQQIRKHHEKWRKWKIAAKQDSQTQSQPKTVTKAKVQENKNSNYYVAEIFKKLNNDNKNKQQIIQDNKSKNDMANYLCCGCSETMVEPRNPITLFPCGHNMCKLCLFGNDKEREKLRKIKIKECRKCTKTIQNYAENRSLMNIISYDNQQEQNTEQIVQNHKKISELELRCQILDKERKSISNALAKERKIKQSVDETISKLKLQKQKADKSLNQAEQENKLIQKFLQQKKQELESIRSKRSNFQEKKRIVQKTLEPLKLLKQKLEVLEVAKMMT